MNTADTVKKARQEKVVIPAFNSPYPEMVHPIINAIKDENSIGMVQVAWVEWKKFGAVSPETIAEQYYKYEEPDYTMLHLDHIPVIDEEYKKCDYVAMIKRGIEAGFKSVMVDASRLPFEENMEATKTIVEMAHAAGVPCEAELGKVTGHEEGVKVPYEEIIAKRIGFTDIDEATQFVKMTGVDWLSVAVGSVHGSVADNLRFEKKPEAILDIEHVSNLYKATGIPLVLHGGSGIKQNYINDGIKNGIAKINIGTEIRQAYLKNIDNGVIKAQEAVYESVRKLIRQLNNTDLKSKLSNNG